MTTTKTKIEALAEFLEIEQTDLNQSRHDENLFENGREEYLVLTDKEADDLAKSYILESAWAFNKSFLDVHSEVISELDEKSFSVIQERCEDANKAILAMIDDKDHFVDDAIKSDGRGHFLSQYDGEEIEQGEYFIFRTN